jgi:ketosteroid isomerase-like protein
MSSEQQIIAEITRLDAERVAATLAKDVAKLNELIADDLRYVHSSATDEGKGQYIERSTTGNYYDYKAFTTLKRDFRVIGDTVLVHGDVKIDLLLEGKPKIVNSRYLQVWARRGGKWQMAAWQSTPAVFD